MNAWLWVGLPLLAGGFLFMRFTPDPGMPGSGNVSPIGPLLAIAGFSLTLVGLGQ